MCFRDGKQEEQERDRTRRGMAMMGQVWEIGQRKFWRWLGEKMWFFDALVSAVMAYGVKI